MNNQIRIVSLCFTVALCSAVTSRAEEPDKATDKEWIALFDGTEASARKHWRMYSEDKFPDFRWEVVDGTLHIKPIKNAPKDKKKKLPRADLMTKRSFANFELRLDFKFGDKLMNSGVFYRTPMNLNSPAAGGFEYQLVTPDYKGGKLPGTHLTAGFYAICAAKDAKLNLKDWNSLRIVCSGNHIEHWLNEKKTVSIELGSDDYKKRFAKSKFASGKNFKNWGKAKTGTIGLQDHGATTNMYFRNIRIREIGSTQSGKKK